MSASAVPEKFKSQSIEIQDKRRANSFDSLLEQIPRLIDQLKARGIDCEFDVRKKTEDGEVRLIGKSQKRISVAILERFGLNLSIDTKDIFGKNKKE